VVDLSRNALRGMFRFAKKGNLTGMLTPYGYDRVYFNAAGKAVCRIRRGKKYRMPRDWTAARPLGRQAGGQDDLLAVHDVRGNGSPRLLQPFDRFHRFQVCRRMFKPHILSIDRAGAAFTADDHPNNFSEVDVSKVLQEKFRRQKGHRGIRLAQMRDARHTGGKAARRTGRPPKTPVQCRPASPMPVRLARRIARDSALRRRLRCAGIAIGFTSREKHAQQRRPQYRSAHGTIQPDHIQVLC
jgi:hypothetical protein